MSDTLAQTSVALAGRYIIERELGRGGMATVFAAADRQEQRQVAVKVLHRELSAALGHTRFRREIEIASSLSHPHILPVFDAGEANGELFLVMPLVTGESLAARLERERQLPVEEAVRLTREVASALAYAHARGVVHRDIKPDNILLQDGHALVADFGIARAAQAGERLTQTGMSMGTPAYMSPEQAAAERDLDGRSDQYSLGCVLFEMLAGGPPFSAPTAQGLMARHALEAVPSITIVRDTVPEQIEDAIYRALSKVPADRFASVQEFADSLGTPDLWTTARRTAIGRGKGWAGADRRRSKVRRAIYSTAAAVPMLAAGWAGYRYYVRPSPARAAVTAEAAIAARKVAVLYFEDQTADQRLTPVADGLTESLIGQLGQVSQLTVVSRNGVLPYRGADVEPDSIARALRVGTLVRGTVDAARDGTVRVTVRLLDAQSGDDLGHETFKQPATNVLALRDSVAAKVAEFLRQRLGAEVALRESRAGTASVPAWTLVQRAERLRRTADSLFRAGDTVAYARELNNADSLLTGAAALDARWSEPVVRRGEVALQRSRGIPDPADAAKWLDRGMDAANAALALDPRDAGALELRGTLRFARRQRGLAPDAAEARVLLDSAEADLTAATTIDRTRASALNVLSALQYGKLNVAESNNYARRAYEADAYLTAASAVLWRLFATSYDMEQFVDAVHWCDEGRRRFPADGQFVRCELLLLSTKAKEPNVAEAWKLVGEYERLAAPQEREYKRREAQTFAALVIARAGARDSALRVLERARADRAIDPRGEVMGYEAFVRAQMGDREESIGMLQRYLAAHPEHRAGFAKANAWWWRSLQDDPRFKAMAGTSG